MAITTGQLRNFLEGTAKKMELGLSNRSKQAVYSQILDVSSTQKESEVDLDIENMTSLPWWSEGAPRSSLDFEEGYSQRYTQTQWAGLVDVTKPMKHFSQLDLFKRLVSQMLDASYKTKETICAAYLEYGDVTSGIPQAGGMDMVRTTGGDSLALFHTAHTWRSSGANTYPNKSASLDSLTETALNTAYERLRRWTDNTGAPLNLRFTGLILPPDLMQEGWKVMRSRLEPATANNAINTAQLLSGTGITEYQWLSDTTDWYLKTDAKGGGNIRFIMGWDNDVETGKVNPRTGNECATVDFSVAHGCNRLLKLYKNTA